MKKISVLMMLIALIAGGVALADHHGGAKVGWIVDAKCGANGAKESHAGCAKSCVDSGQPLVFVNDADKSVYTIDNQDAANGHVGHKVTVTGKIDGDSIHISSLKM
jgi:hypothetical protein